MVLKLNYILKFTVIKSYQIDTIAMILTRKERTKNFRKQVEHEWNVKYKNFIENNLDKPWNWGSLSANINTTFDMVVDHLDKPWDWYNLSFNPNITLDNVLAYPDKPWDWEWLSQLLHR